MTNTSTETGQTTASVLTALGTWWRNFSAQQQTHGSMVGLTHADVELIARDVGLCSKDLYDLASKNGHAADQVPDMMRALGLDPAEVQSAQHAAYADLLVTCSRCDEKRHCTHDLKAGTAAAHFEEYCLNANTLNALRAIAACPRV